MATRKDVFTADLRLFNDVLSTTPMAGRYWVMGSVLLGWARERQLLGHDADDVDFFFLREDMDRLLTSFPALEDAGFQLMHVFPGAFAERPTEFTFERHQAKFELWCGDVVHEDGRAWLYYRSYGSGADGPMTNVCRLPAQPLDKFAFLGRTWLKPRDHDVELTGMYDDWRTPDPSWNYMQGPAIVKRHAWDSTTFDRRLLPADAPARARFAAPAMPRADAPACSARDTESEVSPAETIAVVLVACDQDRALLRCLTALSRVESPEFEAIVVDNGSRDDTAMYLAQVSGDLTTITEPEPIALAHAREQALAATSASLVCFVNCDAVPVDGWLQTLYDTLASDPLLGAVAASTVDAYGRRHGEECWDALLVRRTTYEQAGGFSGAVKPGVWEGFTLLEALREQGWKVASVSNALMLMSFLN